MFLAAILIFVRDRIKRGATESVDQGEGDPAIHVQGLLVYTYADTQLRSRSIAGFANYLAPDRLELDGRISIVRYLENDRTESAFADKAVFTLEERNLSQMTENAEVRKVELIENVVIKVNEHVLRTPFAEYFPRIQEIRTDWNVEVTGPGRVFEGDSGMSYKIDSEDLKIFGLVSGREVNTPIFR